MPTSHTATRSHAATATRTRKAPPADAIKLLRADHAEVKKLFAEYDKLAKAEADASEREALALDICAKLTVHAQIEEEIFYPACRDVLQDQDDLLDEATVEHASAKDLIAQLQSSSPDDDMYDAKVKVLGEYIDHHVKEEQNELFPKVRPKLDRKELGEQLQARKDALLARLDGAH
ncbi:hemerythrin domain-containing protein [Rhizobacter sp. OV335]|uniref:hemerythrin domain-containing protein n=1 Tax=Rhizobacter sp. OV335 TaxID=1500264 RepID=UPI000920C0B4|nr:hemerythrin domain-containing protein [Rhizobacter sp. OV335]SHN34158.1 Hemerythrin HHE cation binding domain-containing protein [Rhizobacter sp. OV335]